MVNSIQSSPQKKKKKEPKLPWLWLIHEKKNTRYFRYKSISIVRTLRINIFLFLLFINLLRTSNRALNSWNLLFTYSESTMRYPQTDKCTRHVCCFSLIVSQPPINLFALLNTSVPIHQTKLMLVGLFSKRQADIRHVGLLHVITFGAA